jgi:hypothetical protein
VLGEASDAALGRIKETAVELADQVSRTRPDCLLLREGASLQACSPLAYRKAHATVRNVARYYDVPLGFVFDSIAYLPAEMLSRLQPDLVVILADAENLPPADALSALELAGGALGAPVDLNNGSVIADRLHAYGNRLGTVRWLASAAQELPANTDLTAVRAATAAFA